MAARFLLAAALGLAAGGCYVQPAGQVGTIPNQPQTLKMSDAPAGDIYQEMRDLVIDNDWWLAAEDPEAGQIVAITDTETAGGMVTRRRWVLTAGDGTARVQSFLEYASGGRWQSTDEVCDTYAYRVEWDLLTAVADRMARRGGVSVAEGPGHEVALDPEPDAK